MCFMCSIQIIISTVFLLLLSGTFFLVEGGTIWFKFNLGECVMRSPKKAFNDSSYEIITKNAEKTFMDSYCF